LRVAAQAMQKNTTDIAEQTTANARMLFALP